MDAIDILGELPTVITAIQYMHRNLQHTEDFKFISSDGKQEFSCHSLIAAIHSWVLCDKIYGSSNCRHIQIEDTDNVAVENMIRYFYEDDVIFQSVSDIVETKRLADAFEIPQLGRICIEEFCNMNVNISNVISILKTSLKYNDTEKESECLSLITENKEAVFASLSFISLNFQIVLDIFVKLRNRNSLTESEFLHYGIKWLEANEISNTDQKNFLMNKIDVSKILLNEFLDIVVSSPEFFSNVEISHAVNLIKSNECSTNEQAKNKADLFENSETNTEREIDHTYKDAESNTDKIDCIYEDTETNTEKANHQKLITDIFNVKAQKLKCLIIEIVKKTDTCNSFSGSETVQITSTDDIATRFLYFPVCQTLKEGLIGSMEKNIYFYKDLDISYEGIYCMSKVLQRTDLILSPLQHIEVLKAAIHFKLETLSKTFAKKIANIVSYDPLYLDSLRFCSKSKCCLLLKSQPLEVILHPNFIYCSEDLIYLLLDQDELKIRKESELLLAIIEWLEAWNRHRWQFRSCFLNKIAFENISIKEFQNLSLGSVSYPDFFDDNEKKSIFIFKTAEGEENIRKSRENLPGWYNFKYRQLIE